ncbi:DUF4142 domain-containing protein [Aureimonas leprariae]|uniref:DUF4142 domain-containing protein n=1 Tax=Plantimonas leprariae TaxID=2615207 RepID=A0A7V7TUQ1_9HYPH|nr:DUF4142 domain-containing protein [Aureimonas leprariae]KAB0676700.1 DUF4142 domain-containing protein [Aureimonas leprariae]
MSKLTLTAAAFFMTLGSAAVAQTPSVNDDEFLMKAAVGNTFEIEESKLALERASDPKLKQFAQQMIDDHQNALQKLQNAAGDAKGKAEMKLDQPHQAKVDNLKTFNGRDFDKVYIADQIASHDETVSLLSDYDQNGQNDDLGDWVDDALPVVKQHKMMIDAM